MAHTENSPGAGDVHLDEGLAHTWLDGQLPADEAARIDMHIAQCTACAALVAEARGFVAASSRILTGLDGVPARVVPRARSRVRIWQVRAAAAIVVVALGAAAVLSGPGRMSDLQRVAGLGVNADSAPATRGKAALEPAGPAAGGAGGAGRVPGVGDVSTGAGAAVASPRPSPPPPPPSTAPLPARQSADMKRMVQPRHDDAGSDARAKQDVGSRVDENRPAGAPAPDADRSRRTGMAASSPSGGATPPPPAAVTQNGGRMAAAPAPADTIARDRISALQDRREDYAMRKSAPASRLSAQASGGPTPATANATANGGTVPDRSSPAYRACVGRMVTVLVGTDSGQDLGTAVMPVRLDSTASTAITAGAFVATPPPGNDTRGVWLPVGPDSAVVTVLPPVGGANTFTNDSIRHGAPRWSHVVSTRVRCNSR